MDTAKNLSIDEPTTMPGLHQISVDGEITTIKIFGIPTFEDIVKIMEDLRRHHPHELKLYNLVGTQFDLDMGDLRRIADHAKAMFPTPNWMAFYTKDDLTFGELRQFEVFRKENGRSNTGVFRDEMEAREWLLAQKADHETRHSA